MIRTASDIKQLGTILSVWAHPDDETFLAAGIMASAVRNGQPVICVTATKGEAGSQNHEKWPPKTLGEVRTKELGRALGILGVPKHYLLDCPDGGCYKVSIKEAVKKIRSFIDRYQPDTILTFGPEGLTGHHDHATVSLWVQKAVEQYDLKPVVYHAVYTKDRYDSYLREIDEVVNFFFNIDKPSIKNADSCDICFELPKELRMLKYQALEAMPSQTENVLRLFEQQFLCRAFGSEAFIRAK